MGGVLNSMYSSSPRGDITEEGFGVPIRDGCMLASLDFAGVPGAVGPFP